MSSNENFIRLIKTTGLYEFAKNRLVITQVNTREAIAKMPCNSATHRAHFTLGFKINTKQHSFLEYCDQISELLNFCLTELPIEICNNKPIEACSSINPTEIKNTIKKIIQKEINTVKLAEKSKVTFEKIVSEKPYHELFTRPKDRKITILCAPTNSGKTYQGMQIVKSALRASEKAECQMLFPLRVLALQIQEDFNQENIPCSLLTGEEKDIQPNSQITASTVEVFNESSELDTVFLDEGQLAFSDNRSPGYLKVICSAQCKHLVIACAPTALLQMKWFLKEILEVPFEIKYLERLCPLAPIKEVVQYSDIKEGDLVVAFSRRRIHELAEELSGQGLKVATIYGALSPAARRSILHDYRNRKYTCCVATDAIGMGVSAPSKRVLFDKTDKFNGTTVVPLTNEEMRQIAGRAGRFGFEEFGEAGVLMGNDPTRLNELLNSAPEELSPPTKLYVLPSKTDLMATKEIGLVCGLKLWKKAIKKHTLYHVCQTTFEELLIKAEWLDKKLKQKKLTHEEAVRLVFVTFQMDDKNDQLDLFKDWVNSYIRTEKIAFETAPPKANLKKLELMSSDLTLMIQLSRILPDTFVQTELEMNEQQNMLGEYIASILSSRYGANKTKGKKHECK